MTAPPTDPPLPDRPGEADCCAYCGQPLNPHFYFCLACSRPYKPADSVVSPATPMALTDGMLIQRKAPQVSGFFWTYFAVVVGLGVFSHFAFDNAYDSIGILIREAGLLAVTCVFVALHWKCLPAQLNHTGLLRPQTWVGILLLFPLFGLNMLYHDWLFSLAELTDPIDELREAGTSETTLLVTICILPAILEEVSFRGLLQHWLMEAVRPRTALVLTAALFTVLHLSVASAPILFALGLLLGWTKWKSGSLYPVMLIHFAHNLMVLEFS
ncbi:MAG: CPBP family intramembrane glutamic endopeptidase [Planctomycetota bacterium]